MIGFKWLAALAMALPLAAGGVACSGGGGGEPAAETAGNGGAVPAEANHQTESPADMDIKGIREKKSSASPTPPKREKRKKPYEKFDYSDTAQRNAARKQVVADLEEEKERTEEFLEDYDREKIRKERRAESIEKWLGK